MSIRVGTWNVEYAQGAEKNRRRLGLLTAMDADVWVLTETHDNLDLSEHFEPIHSFPRFETDLHGRWVTIWSRLPAIETIPTADVSRTVAATIDAGSDGPLIVYGTVLPWHSDPGPDPHAPASAWSELHRVIPLQGAEWRSLRRRFPEASLIVAGDLNMNLGGKHYYGTKYGRAVLRRALAEADMVCLTETENFPPGQLDHPPIDHICAGPRAGLTLASVVIGWNKQLPDGVVVSDHSGVLADLTFTDRIARN